MSPQDDTRVSPQTEDHSAEKEGAFRSLPVVANRTYLYMGTVSEGSIATKRAELITGLRACATLGEINCGIS